MTAVSVPSAANDEIVDIGGAAHVQRIFASRTGLSASGCRDVNTERFALRNDVVARRARDGADPPRS